MYALHTFKILELDRDFPIAVGYNTITAHRSTNEFVFSHQQILQGSMQLFLRKYLATCDFKGGGVSGPPPPPDPSMMISNTGSFFINQD